jgi:hypothetical protein
MHTTTPTLLCSRVADHLANKADKPLLAPDRAERHAVDAKWRMDEYFLGLSRAMVFALVSPGWPLVDFQFGGYSVGRWVAEHLHFDHTALDVQLVWSPYFTNDAHTQPARICQQGMMGYHKSFFKHSAAMRAVHKAFLKEQRQLRNE